MTLISISYLGKIYPISICEIIAESNFRLSVRFSGIYMKYTIDYVGRMDIAAERPNKLPKWELYFGKNYVNTKLRKANKCGPFGST